jgi:SAM-dependent methyltransferase
MGDESNGHPGVRSWGDAPAANASGHLGGGHPAGPKPEHAVFHRQYEGDAPAPWDIGKPQPAMVEATEDGWIHGRVLDVGCGTGENALYFAERGCSVLGVDVVPAAVEQARAKAADRGLDAVFFVADLTAPGPVALSEEKFDTVTDIGFFHTLSDEARGVWVPRLAGLLAAGGSYVMLCFSDNVSGTFGPRRISEAELRETFGPEAGFSALDVEPTRLEANAGPGWVDAWLVRAVRAG